MKRYPPNDYRRDFLTRACELASEKETPVYCPQLRQAVILTDCLLAESFNPRNSTTTMSREGRNIAYVYPMTSEARRGYGGLLLDFEMVR